MARKKTSRSSSKRKAPRKSKKGSNASIVVALIGVIIILGVIVSYYYTKEIPSSRISEDKQLEEKTASDQKQSRQEQKTTAPDGSGDISPEKQASPKTETPKVNPELPDYDSVDEYYFTSSFTYLFPPLL